MEVYGSYLFERGKKMEIFTLLETLEDIMERSKGRKYHIDYNLYDYPEYLLDQEAGFGACEGYRTGADKVPYLGKEKFCALAYWNSLSADYQSMKVCFSKIL